MSKAISAVFYGKAGTGKTTLSETFPGDNLLIDIKEHGTDSICDSDKVQVLTIDDWSQYEDIYWELKGGKHSFKTVTVDALHSLQGLAISEAKARKGKNKDLPTSQNDFGQAGQLLLEWGTNYRDLVQQGINVIFLVHDRITEVDTDEDEEVINPEVGPRLMPSVASGFSGMVNIVGNTFIREVTSRTVGKKKKRKVEYCLRIGPHGYYLTKIRKPKKYMLPEFIVDPTYEKIKQVMEGKYKPEVVKTKTLKRRKK